jgi:hypothetical protein
MKLFLPFLRIAAALIMVAIIIGCSAPQAAILPTATSVPTIDIPGLHTQVAQTVIAELTVQAALNPSPTLVPKNIPTDTAPSQAPSPTNIPAVTIPPLPTIKPPATAVPVWNVQPTFTKTPYTDACTLLSTDPEDGKVMSSGEEFVASWVVKNTGMRPWNTRFYFKKLKGTLGNNGVIYLSGPVDKGSEYNLRITMVSPTQTGVYNGTYRLINDDGVAICQFFVAIAVK